jgi:hypothetical protein
LVIALYQLCLARPEPEYDLRQLLSLFLKLFCLELNECAYTN